MFPKTKTISVGIIYKSPSQIQFIEQKITEFVALSNLITKFTFLEILIQVPYKYILNKPNETKKIDKDLLPEIKTYKEFCSMYGLSQLIDYPTRITNYTTTLTDQILTENQENISKSGIN